MAVDGKGARAVELDPMPRIPQPPPRATVAAARHRRRRRGRPSAPRPPLLMSRGPGRSAPSRDSRGHVTAAAPPQRPRHVIVAFSNGLPTLNGPAPKCVPTRVLRVPRRSWPRP